ncbi:helix-turn-helix domain-containing protein [Streptomyces sp. NPDC058289]|uniref:helix-turn-helix domain-containing protein n=1 Tax=Streptomyces sp. NPDC058289 TaxID=3346425 RepID=UPI0036EB4569
MEAPPTPPVALGRLLADHELGLRHLAGPAEAELHGVHASEMTDPSPYLLGGELLLTAGEGLTGAGAWPAGGTGHGAGGWAEAPGAEAWPAEGTEHGPGDRAKPSGAEARPADGTEHGPGDRAKPSGAGARPADGTEHGPGDRAKPSGAGARPAEGTERDAGDRAKPSGVEAWLAEGTEHGPDDPAKPPGAAGGLAGAGLADVRPGHGGAGHADSGRAHTLPVGTNPGGTNPVGAGHAGDGLADAGLIDAGPYVARLVRAGVGAIGFGVTPVYTTVPQSLVEACDRYGLPLVEVPPGTPFTAVGRSVWRLMAQARTAELRRVTEAQQSLAAAAARPDPVPAVLRRLAATLGGWAGLLPAARPDAPSATGPGTAGAEPAAGVGTARPAAPGAAGAGPAPTARVGIIRPAAPGAGAGPAPTAGAGTVRPGATGAEVGPAPTAGTGSSHPATTGAGDGAGPSGPADADTRREAEPRPIQGGPHPAATGPEAGPAPTAGTGSSHPATTGAGDGAGPSGPAGADTRREQGITGAEPGQMHGGPRPAATEAGAGPAPAAGATPGTTPGGPAGPATGVSAGTAPAPDVIDALGALARRVAPGSAVTATAAHGGLHLSVHALGDGWVLALATPTRAPGDHTVASVAAVLLTLLTARRPAGAQAALTRLLLGGEPAGALGPGPWYAVHARGAGDPRALAAALGTVLLDPRGESVGEDPAHLGSVHADSVRLLTDREPGPQPGWRLGVSAPTRPEGLPGADAQARRALERAEAARTPLARHTEPGLAGLVGAAEARAHAEALLGPLSPVLRDTLRTWLAHHGSWDRSAAALGIHRNTVRQRIARAAALLGSDLDDPDTRMELWFALRHLDGPDVP